MEMFFVKFLEHRLFYEYDITLSSCVTVCWIKQRCRLWELAVIKWTPPEGNENLELNTNTTYLL
ncbi:hypothetical protein GmHk_11G032182 [Glycine max]|nr:hypothetical protein GmHk_11G032182 [Glycine max]